MVSKLNLQYLIDKEGNKTAVIIPINEWANIVKSLPELMEYQKLKNGIAAAYKDVVDMKKGEKTKTTLSDFFDEK